MTTAAVLFGIAALGGVVMAIMRLTGRELPPMGLAIVHGLFAASGLVALLFVVVGRSVSTQATIALVGFVIAALGGFFLFSYHLRRQALPIPVVIIHGLVAVVSFVVLLLGIFALRS
jgi:glucose uptake protein GlcU